MINSVLQTKWEGLSSHKVKKGFRSIRISSECVADLFIGENNAENRCLILSLPKEHNVDCRVWEIPITITPRGVLSL